MNAPWTTEQKIKSLLRLPWTITSEPSGDPGEFVARIRQMPDVVVIGTREEIDAEFWNAFRASTEARLDFGDPIQLPDRARGLPWELGHEAQPRRVMVIRQARADVSVVEMPETAYS